jgi:hypothetical protein
MTIENQTKQPATPETPTPAQRAEQLVNQFVQQAYGTPITLTLSKLGVLAAAAIAGAVEDERWACVRDLDPSKWVYHIENDDYMKGFAEGVRQAQQRIAQRIAP